MISSTPKIRMDEITVTPKVQELGRPFLLAASGTSECFDCCRFRKALRLNKKSLKHSVLFSVTVTKNIKQVFLKTYTLYCLNREILRFFAN